MPTEEAARSDDPPSSTVTDDESYSARKITLFLALIILISQFQLAFCTKYEYTYEVEHIHEGGDGDTYAYNIWHGIVQLYDDGGGLTTASSRRDTPRYDAAAMRCDRPSIHNER